MQPNLFEIRCPFQRLAKKDGKLYTCNSVCVKVTAGSAGEARCRKCHLTFEFEVDSRARRSTGVRVKSQEAESSQNVAQISESQLDLIRKKINEEMLKQKWTQ